MRSKASYFSVSAPLIKENLRRFWAIPVLSFLVYFLSGVFPILMSYNKLHIMASYIEMSLHNMQPFFMAAHLLVPVLSAVVLLRYLQSVSSVAVMHSLPFTRPKLFNTGFLSGLMLTLLPVLINGMILLLLSKPTYRQWGYGADLTIDTVDVFSRAEILNWILTSVIIIAVLYSVSFFTGIVTGNMLMHLLTSFFFIFLIPILYGVFTAYFMKFLYGFNKSGDWIDIALSISPYTGILNSGGYFSIPAVLYYSATFILMTGISAFLYNKRKLERASDSLTFDFMKPVLCYVIAFLGMTLLGFYFEVLGEAEFYMYAGFAAGTVIFFIIGQMIVMKSVRIFNREGLVSFLVYALIAVLFLVGVNFDVTGFERRVPNPEKVESAMLSDNYNSVIQYYYYNQEKHWLKNPDNIKAITDFHRSITENRERFENPDANRFSSSVIIDYDTGGLFNMSRAYLVDYEFFAKSEEMKRVFESLEYKAIYSLYNLGADAFTRINIYGDTYKEMYGETNKEIYRASDIEELISCMEKDFREMTFEDLISLRPYYANAEISYTYTELDEDIIGGRDLKGYTSFRIPLTAENTINWLEAHGYSFGITPDMVEYINIYEAVSPDEKYYPAARSYTVEKDIASVNENTPLMHITDKEDIQKILDTYELQQINYDEGYRIEIKINQTVSGPEMAGYSFAHGYLNYGLDFLN